MYSQKNKPVQEVKNNELQLKQQQEDKRIKYFIQLLDVNRDTNMTRVYSAMQSLKK